MAAIMERDQSKMEIMERSGEREMGTGEMERWREIHEAGQ